MTTFNTDYSNTELLDQELTTAELSQVSGGMSDDERYEQAIAAAYQSGVELLKAIGSVNFPQNR